MVIAPDVVRVAIPILCDPILSSLISVAPDQAAPLPVALRDTTPINAPPTPSIIDPVVSRSSKSISLEASPPAAENSASPILKTEIEFCAAVGLTPYVTAISAVVPVGTLR